MKNDGKIEDRVKNIRKMIKKFRIRVQNRLLKWKRSLQRRKKGLKKIRKSPKVEKNKEKLRKNFKGKKPTQLKKRLEDSVWPTVIEKTFSEGNECKIFSTFCSSQSQLIAETVKTGVIGYIREMRVGQPLQQRLIDPILPLVNEKE